jgi:hypothetical protein
MLALTFGGNKRLVLALLQVGPISAGLPTLGIEGRFIGALQT